MQNTRLSLRETGQFSTLFLDYLDQKQELGSFYNRYPDIDQFEHQLESKTKTFLHRELLVEVLTRQNTSLSINNRVVVNIEKLLSQNCFTVTTGHQLCLATGPMYFIYKILTVIRLSEELKLKYPEKDFIPLFWMATEDHDLEEINHFYLFGKKFEWQINGKGASGKIATEDLRTFFATVPDCPEWLIDIYCESKSLSEATRKLVDYLFGEYGLVILDGDDKALKSLFASHFQDDLLAGKYSPIVRATSQSLESNGYKAQAFVREHNVFYLQGDIRERIEKNGDSYQVVNTNISFSEDELKAHIQDEPENFSPNVLLRPLYQETILPNLAYIGGPGELAYWFQLKGIFEAEDIPFPILFPRKFATIIPRNVQEKLVTIGIDVKELFRSEDEFKGLLLEKLQVEKYEFHEEGKLLQLLKQSLQSKATKADKSLLAAVEAEMAKTSKGISDLEKRINKALESRHETDLSKLQNMRRKLFPGNGLQERNDNFLNFYINRPNLISELHAVFDPFEFQMECLVF